MINWKVRLKSPAFWTGLIGVLGAFAVGMAQLFGVDITAEAGSWQQALTALVTAVFGVLALVGVTTDPTTKGLGDSAQALTYHKPKDDRRSIAHLRAKKSMTGWVSWSAVWPRLPHSTAISSTGCPQCRRT